jgi:hypothetical protein
MMKSSSFEPDFNAAASHRGFSGNGGVIVTAGGTAVHRELIIRLAARYNCRQFILIGVVGSMVA